MYVCIYACARTYVCMYVCLYVSANCSIEMVIHSIYKIVMYELNLERGYIGVCS